MNELKRNRIIKASLIYAALFLVMALAALFKLIFFSGFASFGKEQALGYVFLLVGLFLLVFIYALYGFLARKFLVARLNELGVVCTCIAITYTVCIFVERISLFLMPAFLAAFLLAPVCKRKDSFAANIFCLAFILLTLVVKDITASVENLRLLMAYVIGIFSGTLVVFGLSYQRRRLDFLLKGVALCLGTVFLVMILDLLACSFYDAPERDLMRELAGTLMWSSIAVFSQLILSLVLQPVLEKVFNLLTNLRLTELMDHNSPLIKRLINEAPGTFNHSVALANFAEVCATAIGENPYMARACAYYHDIGKLNKPMFFKENQPESNPHDEILPEVSAEIIRNHTGDGLELCRKYRIPKEIAEITIEHHGQMPISIFYNKAKELTDEEVDVKDYSYNGSKPTTKIAAIIMICDSSEAAIRSMNGADPQKADNLVTSLIWDRIKSGQFDECPIMIKELYTIKETILGAYGGVYHKRIAYPKGNEE